MKTNRITAAILICILTSCTNSSEKDNSEQWKQEIIQAEEDFAAMVKSDGIHDAFVAFADDNATLIRGNRLIKGKAAIDSLYKDRGTKNLSWKADFVEVSHSGDLGFTYGEYAFTQTDSLGNEVTDIGIFHTTWKRQTDGSWKYIVD